MSDGLPIACSMKQLIGDSGVRSDLAEKERGATVKSAPRGLGKEKALEITPGPSVANPYRIPEVMGVRRRPRLP